MRMERLGQRVGSLFVSPSFANRLSYGLPRGGVRLRSPKSALVAATYVQSHLPSADHRPRGESEMLQEIYSATSYYHAPKTVRA